MQDSMKASKESSSRLCPLGDVSLSAARWGVSGLASPSLTRRGLLVGPAAAPPPACLRRRDVLGSPGGQRPRDLWLMVGGGRRSDLVSSIGPSGSVSGWPAVIASPPPCAAISGGSARCIAGRTAPPPGSPIGVGVAVRCAGPRISSAPTVGSPRWGWVGSAGGSASSFVGSSGVHFRYGRRLGPASRVRRLRGARRGRWCVPGPGRGPARGLGDRVMTVLLAAPSARLVGRGVAGKPVQRVSWPVGPPCRALFEPGGLGPQWGLWCGGARCRRAGRWWFRSA